MTGLGRVLVTGAGGFLGGWLCHSLLQRGWQVIALDRDFPDGSMAAILADRMLLLNADLEDYDGTLAVLLEHRVDFIFHLAAQALVQIAARDPLSTFRSNIEGTWNILEAVRAQPEVRAALKGLIVTSSDKAYGDQTVLPYVEDAPMEGRFPYDVSKSCADLIARSYFHSYGLPVSVTRCGNLYGGGDFAFSRIVPGTIKSILAGQRPVIRSDGTPMRDYVYVKDAVLALIAIAQEMMSDSAIHGEAFNISNEEPITVLNLVQKILHLMQREDMEPLIEGNAPLEIQAQFLCSRKIQQRLGWRPDYDLESGLRETIDWYRSHHLNVVQS